MFNLNDGPRLVMDGTYVNAPDLHSVQPSRKIGLREFNNAVLVHNWYEDRSESQRKEYPKNTSYNLDYKHFPDSKPDTVLRKKLLKGSEGKGTRNLIGHHNFDSSKNMITIYDEQISKRSRPGPELPQGQQYPEKRTWKIINGDAWVPEKIDYPLQASPTSWGLVEKKTNDTYKEQDKYVSQLPNLSEYNEKFQKHADYSQRVTTSVPTEISSSNYDLNVKLNHNEKPRQMNGLEREPQARDFMDTVYHNMLDRSNRAPRTFYYLGKVPADGSLDVYSMKDFETLTPKCEKN